MAGVVEPSSTLTLARGLAEAARALRANAGEAASFNARAIGADKLLLVFLTGSTAAFLRLAQGESSDLGHERRLRAKAERDSAMRTAASLAALEPAKAAEVAPAPTATSAPAPVARRRKGRPESFWADLRFLMAIALPGGPLSRGGALLGTQFGLLVVRTLLTVRATKTSTFFLTKSIAMASWKYWTRWVVHFGGWCCSATVVNSGLRYVETLLAVELRNALTRAAHARYTKGNAFYRTSVLHQGTVDHVDQRICADIEAFSREAARLYGHSFKPLLEFVLSLSESAKELGWSRPVALFSSQIVVTALLRSVTPPLGRMVAKEAALEGGFRAAHSRLIAHAEEIAFLRGGDTERAILNTRFSALMSTQRWHALQRIRKSVAENIGKFQGLFVGGVFVHIPFLLRTDASEGDRISSFRATEELMLRSGAAFVDVMQLGKSLDELAGHTSRIRELFRALDASAQPSAARLLPTPGDRISFRGVTVCAPEPGGEPRLLVRRLDLELPARRCLMITGPNGSGKTSTMRVLAGLWPPAEGTVTCPPQGILWLPQKPFLVSGTLRDQVTYPALAGSQRRFDSRVRDCLAKAGVAALGDSGAGLDREHAEWDDVLSGGERQRVGFARLFYHAPRYAILDEATSACNAEGEASLYAACLEEGITLLSIAHRMELRRFHSAELRLVGDGSGAWTLTELVDGAPAAAAAAHGAPGALRAAAAASAP